MISVWVAMKRGSDRRHAVAVVGPEQTWYFSAGMRNCIVRCALYFRAWRYVATAAVMTTSRKDSSTMPNRTRITRQ